MKIKFLLGLLLLVQVIIFAPHVGTGFVTDDFTWLTNAVSRGEVDYSRAFTVNTGFYRPLVGLTFGLQYQLHGMNARAYGWFNLFLHLLNIILVYLVFSCVEVTRPYSLAAAGLFSVNCKGNIMAVSWISGRTTLLFVFFMLVSFYLYLEPGQPPQHRQKRDFKRIFLSISAALCYLAALLSKETAIAAPVFVFFSLFLFRNTGYKDKVKWLQAALVFILPLIPYCLLRLNSNAINPFNAPDVYRYTLAPAALLKNFLEYITRAGMLDILIIVWLLLVVLCSRRGLKPIAGRECTAPVIGLGWFLCFLLPVLALPVRSDIYVYLPQTGLHLMALVLIFRLWEKTGKTGAVLLSLVLLIVAWMGYLYVRVGVAGEKGKSSVVFTRQVLQAAPGVKVGSRVFIIDMDRDNRLSPTVTVSYGFASLLDLYFPHKHLTGEIISPGSAVQIKYDAAAGNFNFFFWGNGRLAGPFDRTGLRELIIFYSYRIMGLSGSREKQENPPDKRLYRLKKRKLRLER